MEYMPGRTLAEVIPRDGLDLSHVLRYGVYRLRMRLHARTAAASFTVTSSPETSW